MAPRKIKAINRNLGVELTKRLNSPTNQATKTKIMATRKITVDMGEVKIIFDTGNPTFFEVRLYEEDCSVDTADYYSGEAFIEDLEDAIRLFKETVKSNVITGENHETK